jgi:acylpyruvate hydrolase
MKIVAFGPERRAGALVAGGVVDLGVELGALIAGGEAAIEQARRRVAERVDMHDAATIGLQPPLARDARVACIAANFAACVGALQKKRNPDPSVAVDLAAIATGMREGGLQGFWKVARPVGDGDDVTIPSRTQRFDYESEVAIVIGRRGKRIRADRIGDYVWGVTLFQDWSARDGIKNPAQQFRLEKNFDASFSIGPCIIVNDSEAGDDVRIDDVDVETYVNGERRQNFNTRDMVFSFAECVEFLSRDLTLEPGDVISGGTGAGTCGDSSPDRFLQAGDVVEIRSPQIGTLRNQLIAPE